MIVNIIVSHCKNNGIGKNNELLWKCDTKKLTIGNKNNAAIMGKKTYESLKNVNGLNNIDNLILSKSLIIDKLNGKNIVKSFQNLNVIEDFVKLKNYDELWVIGGQQIYKLFLDNYKQGQSIFNINEIIITYIDKEFECDTYFPDLKEYTEKHNLYFYSKTIVKVNDAKNIDSKNIDAKNIDYNIYEIIYKYL